MATSASKLVNQSRQKDSLTENGAVTNSTTLSGLLDLFFIAGSARKLSDTEIWRMISSAWVEDALITTKLIFWAGDIRGGAGERRFLKVELDWLYKNAKDTFYANLHLIKHYNRWDILFNYPEDSKVMDYIYENYKAGDALLCKWLPRPNRDISDKWKKFLATFKNKYKISAKDYRKHLSKNTKVVETSMCNKEWGKINYEHVPSVAMKKYRKAFYRNDEARFAQYIEDVKSGTKKINASAIFPTDIIKELMQYHRGSDRSTFDVPQTVQNAINVQWSALPDYLKDSTESILPVCDCSGSMYPNAIVVALAMTLYISERNNSIFKDAFITFSTAPSMNYLKGNVVQRINQLIQSGWGYSTNVLSVFELILDTAIKNSLSQEDLPSKVLLLSDMEFNSRDIVAEEDADTVNNTIKQMFLEKGYKAPEIVYWNIESRSTNNFPVSYNDSGVGMVSGQSPSILKAVLSNEISPMKIMESALNVERYAQVKLNVED